MSTAVPPRDESFWKAGEGMAALADPTPHGSENALQKLGRPPFEKSIRTKFRLLGYLATVYEHVAHDHATPTDHTSAHADTRNDSAGDD